MTNVPAYASKRHTGGVINEPRTLFLVQIHQSPDAKSTVSIACNEHVFFVLMLMLLF